MEKRLYFAELRASSTGNAKKVSGIAARYGVLSHSLGGFKERIKRGAFARAISEKQDTIITFNHNPSAILGRTSAGTLQLRDTEQGLAFDCDLPNTSYARDLHELVLAGNVRECSFAFTLGEGDDEFHEEQDEDRSRVLVRTIKNVSKLIDVSLVTSPAYPGTSASARATVVAAEVRGRVERIGRVQAIAAKRQEEIDDLVNNRDLTKYSLSGWEEHLIRQRKAAIDVVLD
jgi:hypothetical protein